MACGSTIDQLPSDIKSWLDDELLRHACKDYTGLAKLLNERGCRISKAVIGQYGAAVELRQQVLRASIAGAKSLLEIDVDDEMVMGQALVSLVQQKLFELLMGLEESDMDPVQLGRLTRAVADLSRADLQNKKYAAEVQARVAARMQEMAGESGRGGRKLDKETLDYVTRQIYGVV